MKTKEEKELESLQRKLEAYRGMKLSGEDKRHFKFICDQIEEIKGWKRDTFVKGMGDRFHIHTSEKTFESVFERRNWHRGRYVS
jgi:hypothetical protein